MEKKETVKYVLRIEPELKNKLQEEAAKDGRSLNSYICHVLKNKDGGITITGSDLVKVFNKGKRGM